MTMKHKRVQAADTNEIALILSRNLSFKQRAQMITFANVATLAHWAEVIDTMQRELCRQGRCPYDGEPETHR
jgi:hypothetical protein